MCASSPAPTLLLMSHGVSDRFIYINILRYYCLLCLSSYLSFNFLTPCFSPTFNIQPSLFFPSSLHPSGALVFPLCPTSFPTTSYKIVARPLKIILINLHRYGSFPSAGLGGFPLQCSGRSRSHIFAAISRTRMCKTV